MPWKQPSVNSRNTGRWKRISRQARNHEPLCRLCSAAGKVEPATVVDHIRPLAQGGSHASHNLMPLCKRCHDTIKTPADNAEMTRAVPCVVKVLMPVLRSAIPCTMNGIEMRYSLSAKLSPPVAHKVVSAAIEGVVRACRDGTLPLKECSIVFDDIGVAHRFRACYGVDVEEISIADQRIKTEGHHEAWIEAFRSSERAKRGKCSQGGQSPRGGSDQRSAT